MVNIVVSVELRSGTEETVRGGEDEDEDEKASIKGRDERNESESTLCYIARLNLTPQSTAVNHTPMWERTLQDLIRGLRANKNDEAKFIAQANEEIRREIKSKDMELKAGAVMKLTYVRVSSPSVHLHPELISPPPARHAGL